MSKLSSRQKKLEAELDAAKPGTFEPLKIALGADVRDLTAVTERRMFRERQRLLVELANMRDGGVFRFRRAFAFFRPETDSFLLNVRNSLRQVWLRSTPLREKQTLVDGLIAASFVRPGYMGVQAPLRVGHLVVNPQDFRAQLAVAILENWRRFAICENPECPAQYFLAKRKDQKYCERGECTAQAQREYARKWWSEHGTAWRASRKKGKDRQKAKGKSQRRTKR